MRRPPRRPDTPVLTRAATLWALVQGMAVLIICSGALFGGVAVGMPERDLRSFVFTTLVLMNFGLIMVNRSFHSSLREAVFRRNPALWALAGAVTAVLAVALYWPPAQNLFRFGPLHWDDLAICAAIGLTVIAAMELAKGLFLRIQQ